MPDPTRAEQDELRRLREIVSRLPHTADGAPIVPHSDMETFEVMDGEVVRGYAFQFDYRDLSKVYSTREAALAAAPTANP